ncbi:hypothetical protein QR680_014660 [Steinernema hermaphroditum]|uniref:ubiquitinyl hydrolase 1 n=1 Tax=Steinernema hermaphroditum TaxID=289476 RepID=A0AA39ICD1_9BILA|nr:hypothetical protein QR680_014660 [Steinernema hermaphroditum]
MGLIEKATNTKGVQMNQQTRDELKKVEESHTLAPGDLSPIHSETGSDLDSDSRVEMKIGRKVFDYGTFFIAGDILYDDTVRRCLSPLYTKYPDMFWQWRVCDLFGITEPPGPHDLDLSLSGPYDPRKAPSFDRDHLKIVIADGNCGFRAIAHVISGDEEHHHFVRKKVCEFIEKKDDRWIRALTQRRESPIEYLNRTKMRESAIYMTEVELQAVAELLQAHIVCFGELWQRYNPDFPTNLRKLYTDSKLHDGRPVIALLLRNAHFYLIKKL